MSVLLVSAVVFTFASKGGGGGDKKKNNSMTFKTDFTPIRTAGGFTLKSGPAYSGSFMLGREKDTRGMVSVNSLVTYQKGNTIFIMPYRYKISTDYLSAPKNNLRLLDLKINMHK
ncbi:MAG: hypothetical protein P4L51_18065 [Puia sp.]|nr:hypothetical protein [Puia sp.]